MQHRHVWAFFPIQILFQIERSEALLSLHFVRDPVERVVEESLFSFFNCAFVSSCQLAGVASCNQHLTAKGEIW